MGQVHTGLARKPGCARKHQGLLVRLPGRLYEQVAEHRMRLVAARFGQCQLAGREQLQLHGHLPRVAQLDLAELDVVLRADPYRGMGAQVCPARLETHPVGVKFGAVAGQRVRRGMARERYKPARGLAHP
jgi:hypothetical protein